MFQIDYVPLPPGGWGNSHMKRLGSLVQNFSFDPQEVLKRAWLELFSILNSKSDSIRDRRRTFRNKGFSLSRKFTSLTPDPYSKQHTVNIKCYCLQEPEMLTPQRVRRAPPPPPPRHMGVPPFQPPPPPPHPPPSRSREFP